MPVRLRLTLTALTTGLLQAPAGCAESPPPQPTNSEIAAAIHGCGVAANKLSLTVRRDRRFSLEAQPDVTQRQIECVVDWARKKGLKSGLISQELT
jgi:hypothetical protein